MLKCVIALFFVLSFGCVHADNPPNVVIIFLDDSGWNDFHPFGKPSYPTPHVAQMAKDGTRFNQFYVPQAVCSASRSALLRPSLLSISAL